MCTARPDAVRRTRPARSRQEGEDDGARTSTVRFVCDGTCWRDISLPFRLLDIVVLQGFAGATRAQGGGNVYVTIADVEHQGSRVPRREGPLALRGVVRRPRRGGGGKVAEAYTDWRRGTSRCERPRHRRSSGRWTRAQLCVYFGKRPSFVILLGGSSKQRQSAAITSAQERWRDYRRQAARKS